MTAAGRTAPEARAAAHLLRCERMGARIAGLPDDLAPPDRAEAYRVQAARAALWGAPVAGWKIGATSAGGRRLLGVDGPVAGRVPADRVAPPGATIPLPQTAMGLAEIEIAFRFAADLPARSGPYSAEAVSAAVATLHLAIELPETRFLQPATVGAAQIIADNACGGWLVLGPAVAVDWRSLNLSGVRAVLCAGDGPEAEGVGSNVLGDPTAALVWLVNETTLHGETLVAGQFVSTGSLTAPVPVEPGDVVIADVPPLGGLSATIG